MTDSVLAMFWWLIVAHALCDFALQTEAMAKGKNPSSEGPVPWWYWLTAHSLIHGGAVSLITGVWWLGMCEAVVHWLIDVAKCNGKTSIHTDQIVHVAWKAIWVLTAAMLGVVQ